MPLFSGRRWKKTTCRSKNVSLRVGVLPGNYVKRRIITWCVCDRVYACNRSHTWWVPQRHIEPSLNENECRFSFSRGKVRSSDVKLAGKNLFTSLYVRGTMLENPQWRRKLVLWGKKEATCPLGRRWPFFFSFSSCMHINEFGILCVRAPEKPGSVPESARSWRLRASSPSTCRRLSGSAYKSDVRKMYTCGMFFFLSFFLIKKCSPYFEWTWFLRTNAQFHLFLPVFLIRKKRCNLFYLAHLVWNVLT